MVRGFIDLGDVTLPAVPDIKDEPGTAVWRADRDGQPVVLKLYRRRPAAAALRAGCRARREFEALDRLAAAGVPCTEPVGWSRGRSPAHGHWELLITRELPGVRALRAWLEGGDLAPLQLRLDRLFALVGAVHESGIFHGALWSSNVLSDGRNFWISDLARAVPVLGDIRGGALARAELLDFCYSLATLGVDSARMPLERAGLDGAAAKRFRDRLRRYRPGKRVRQSARARALLVRLLRGSGAVPPGG